MSFPGTGRHGTEGRQQVLPHRVDHGLHLLGGLGDRDHRVLLGQDQAELAVRPVAAESVPRHPELEPVPLLPVGPPAVARVRDVRARRLGHPPGRQQPLAVPHAAVQVQLAEPGDRVGGGVQAAETRVAALRKLQPGGLPDTQRIEQPRPQVLRQRLAGQLLHDRGKRVRGRLVIGKDRARIPIRRKQEETAHGLIRVTFDGRAPGVGEVAAGHRGDVPHQDGTAAGIGDVGRELREVGDHGGIQVQQPLGGGQAGRGAGEALTERVQQMHPGRPVWRPPAGGDQPAMTQDHHAVRFDVRRRLEGIKECPDAARVDALSGGSALPQRLRPHGTNHNEPGASPIVPRGTTAPGGWREGSPARPVKAARARPGGKAPRLVPSTVTPGSEPALTPELTLSGGPGPSSSA
jgi:hypothetical protein